MEPIWVALLIPSLIFPQYFWEDWAYPWAISLLFIFWPLRLFRDRQLAPASPLNLPALFILMWAIVCTMVSSDPQQSYFALAMIASGIALYFAVVNSTMLQEYPLLVVLGLGLFGLALAGLGPAILRNIPNKIFILDPALTQSKPIDILGTGETINSNILAGNLLLAIPFMLALVLHWKWGSHWKIWRIGKALLFGSASLFMISTLILAQSRGSYMALIISLILLFTLRWRWTLLLVAVVIVSAFSVVSWDGLVLLAEAIGSDGSITSLSGRSEIWLGSFFAMLNYPIFGIGLGMFEQTMPQLLAQLLVFQKGTIPHAHNLLLQVGLDLGIPGLLFYAWLWVATFVAQFQTRRFWLALLEESDNDSPTRQQRKQRRSIVLRLALSEGALVTSVALFLHGMVDVTIWGTKPAPISWLLFAITTLLYLPYVTMRKMEIETPSKGS